MTLEEYIEQAKKTDYSEARHDCAMFIANWVDLVLGTQFAAKYRGAYKSILEGLREHASNGLPKVIADELATIEIVESETPQKGAVAILDNGFPAIWDGESCVAPLPSMAGIALIHKKHAVKFYNLI